LKYTDTLWCNDPRGCSGCYVRCGEVDPWRPPVEKDCNQPSRKITFWGTATDQVVPILCLQRGYGDFLIDRPLCFIQLVRAQPFVRQWYRLGWSMESVSPCKVMRAFRTVGRLFEVTSTMPLLPTVPRDHVPTVSLLPRFALVKNGSIEERRLTVRFLETRSRRHAPV
jgi:hypothetical protein